MANKKDFGTVSRGLLGLNESLNNTGSMEKELTDTEKIKNKKEIKIRTTIELSEENLQFIEDIKKVEGGSIRTVLNDLLDDLRISKRPDLDRALEIYNQGRKAWRNL